MRCLYFSGVQPVQKSHPASRNDCPQTRTTSAASASPCRLSKGSKRSSGWVCLVSSSSGRSKVWPSRLHRWRHSPTPCSCSSSRAAVKLCFYCNRIIFCFFTAFNHEIVANRNEMLHVPLQTCNRDRIKFYTEYVESHVVQYGMTLF